MGPFVVTCQRTGVDNDHLLMQLLVMVFMACNAAGASCKIPDNIIAKKSAQAVVLGCCIQWEDS